MGYGLIAAHLFVLSVETVDDGLVADAAHERHKNFEVAVSACDMVVKTRLKERIKALSTYRWLTFAIQQAKKIELVNAECELIIFLKTFFFSVVVLFVVENHEDVV